MTHRTLNSTRNTTNKSNINKDLIQITSSSKDHISKVPKLDLKPL
jgi:hypothetical protein